MTGEPSGDASIAHLDPASPAATWLPARHSLRYQLGELVLGSVFFPAVVYGVHFLDRSEDEAPPPPPAPFPPGVDVAVVPSQPVPEGLPPLTTVAGSLQYVPKRYLNHYVDLRGTFEDYMRRLPAKYRQEMRRRVRRYETLSGGPVDCRVYRTTKEVAEFLRLARALSGLTYQERLLGRGLPSGDDFHRQALELAAHDRVRAFLVHHDGRPIAYGYCEVIREIVSYEHTGYDPAVKPWAPGIVLLSQIVEKLTAEKRFRVLDLGMGDSEYKREHATGTRHCASVMYFRPTLRNRLLVTAHYGVTRGYRGASELLERAGVKARVKRFFRRTATASPS